MLSGIMLTTQDAVRLRVINAMADQAKRVGTRLLEARKELQLTRPQMAARFEETSVTDDYIYRWETGKVMPSEAYQEAIIVHYELDGLADLMGGPKSERLKPATPDLLGGTNGDINPLVEIRDLLRTMQSALELNALEIGRLHSRLDDLEGGQGKHASGGT